MVKIKKKVEETEKDLVEEYGEDAAADIIEERKEASKKEEKPQVVSSKETICEFYGIRDEEILDKEFDLSKYGITKQEEAILRERAEEKVKEELKEVTMDKFELEGHPNAAVLVEKYGIQPHHVVDDKLEELGLSNDEAKLIKDFYDDEILRLYKKVNHLE